MAIHFLEEDRTEKGFNRAEVKRWLMEVIRLEEKRAGVINFIFCSDEFLASVNQQFLKRDYFTDVISFDYSEDDQVSGDVVISVDRVKENAASLGISYLDELKRILVHGLLHLIGYDDTTPEDKANMTGLEDLYLGMARAEVK